MTTPEGKLRDYMLKRCKERGFDAYKLSFENRRGAPDWLLIGNEKHVFVELKAPNGVLSPAQIRTRCSLVFKGGLKVQWCRSEEDVDKAIGVLI